MKKLLQFSMILILTLSFSVQNVKSQGLTNVDYKKALWMTARMYGGQRSGDGPNWLTMDHTPTAAEFTNMVANKGAIQSQFVKGKDFTKDADGTTSLSGGWVDCADHVKFGQTFFYAAYTLLKGYSEFTAGYDDLYNGATYADYQAAGDFTYEGAKGKPNGIPDILDELKYETDFFIKCTPNATTFYSQVGDGSLDHQNWVTSPMMAILPKSQGGQNDGARVFVKNAVDASMSSNCAAALAVMARVYAKFDPAYAATCLTHAVYAYTYAKNNHGTVSAGQFYPANAHWEDDYASACAELYWATNTASYKTEALGLSSSVKDHNYCYNYNNNDDVAAYNLAKLGDATCKTLLTTLATRYIAAVTGGIYNGGDGTWGPLRYNGNAAFIVALYEKLNNITTGDAFIYNQLDYILGKNSSNYSFVVGFNRATCTGCTCSKQPHHRNVYLSNGNTTSGLTIPTHNAQFGYMVGGNRSASTAEDINYYQTQEGGLDYNAGLVSALGYVNSKLAPIDTNKFGHPSPTLGANQSMCGVTSILLKSNVATDTKKTFTWKKDGTTIVSASTTANTYTATAAGVYICQIDSTGWSTSGTVSITATLPDFSIGSDVALCTVTSDTLTAATGTGYSYVWKFNGTAISGATTSSYIAYTAGTYVCTISASGCTAKSDTAIITSSLPTVVNDSICKAGVATLSVTSTGSFAWYNVATGGTVLASGASYSPTISASTIYYVQDASSVNGTVGPTALTSASTTNWGVSTTLQMAFTVGSTFTVNSIQMPINSIYSAGAGTVTVEILDGSGNAFSPAKTFVSNSVSFTTAMAGTLVTIPFSNFTVDKTWGTSLRIRVSAVGFNGALGFNETGGSYPYNSTPSGIMTITGSYNGTALQSAYYLYFYNWKISGGSTCGRAPVLAVIDTNLPCGDTQAPTTPGIISFSATTSTGMTASWAASTDNTAVTGYEVYVNGVLNSTVTSANISLTGLTCNTAYTIKVRAKDAAGNYSAYTADVINITTGTALPAVTTPVTYCQNATATALTATGTALKWYTVATAGTALVSTPTPSTAVTGTTSYYVSQTLTSCESARATLAVTVNAIPTANAGSDVAICIGKSTTLTATGGTSYSWSNGITTTTNTVSPTATTTYNLTATNASGCSATDAIIVTVNALPTVNAGTDIAICLGTATTLTATGGTSYSWSNGITTTTNTVSPTATTTYNLTATNASGCLATDAVIVSVNTIPAAPTVVSPVNYVLNATATALTATGTALKWYTVVSGGTTLASTPTPSTTVTGTVNYYVSQTVSTCESPRASIAVNVSSNQVPTVSITAPTNNATYTAPASITITAIAADADGTIASVKFYNGTTLLGTVTTSPYSYSWTSVAAGTYIITAVATDNVGGTTTSTAITVIVNATQTITLSAGWNILSFNVQPTNMAVSSVFGSLGTNLLTVKNADGFYDPTQAAFQNSLINIENGKGYLVKVTTATTLSVTGSLVGATSLSLKSGWNLVGFPKQTTGAITTVLTGIWTSFTQMKDFNGFYIKGGTLNSLTNMIPNSGYFINVNADCILTY
jgi:hypothetical protein